MRSGIEDNEMPMALKARDAASAEWISSNAISSFIEYIRDVQGSRSLEEELIDAHSRSLVTRGGR